MSGFVLWLIFVLLLSVGVVLGIYAMWSLVRKR